MGKISQKKNILKILIQPKKNIPKIRIQKKKHYQLTDIKGMYWIAFDTFSISFDIRTII